MELLSYTFIFSFDYGCLLANPSVLPYYYHGGEWEDLHGIIGQ
jgi:hypothetical protein